MDLRSWKRLTPQICRQCQYRLAMTNFKMHILKTPVARFIYVILCSAHGQCLAKNQRLKKKFCVYSNLLCCFCQIERGASQPSKAKTISKIFLSLHKNMQKPVSATIKRVWNPHKFQSKFLHFFLAEQAAMNPPSVRIIDSKVELTWTETLSDVQIQYKR